MPRTIEVDQDVADILTQRVRLLERFERDGKPMALLEVPDVDVEVTERVLRRIIGAFERLWGKSGDDDDDQD